MTVHTTLLEPLVDRPAGSELDLHLVRPLGVQRFRARSLDAGVDLPPGTRMRLEEGLTAEVERRAFGWEDAFVVRLVGSPREAALLAGCGSR